MTEIESSFAADSVVMPRFASDAVVRKTAALSFTAAAARKVNRLRSFSAAACAARPYRVQHDRSNAFHHGSTPDTAITLANALGIYVEGMTLHSTLIALVDRVTELENSHSQ